MADSLTGRRLLRTVATAIAATLVLCSRLMIGRARAVDMARLGTVRLRPLRLGRAELALAVAMRSTPAVLRALLRTPAVI